MYRGQSDCNGEWGTICADGFGSNDTSTVCKQLGYNSYYNFNYQSDNSCDT